MQIKIPMVSALLLSATVVGCNRAPEAPKSGPQIVTSEEAKQLQTGMSMDAVQKVIGDPGKEISKGDMAGRKLQTYAWNNPDGSGVTVMFEDGKMTSAMPVNLLK